MLKLFKAFKDWQPKIPKTDGPSKRHEEAKLFVKERISIIDIRPGSDSQTVEGLQSAATKWVESVDNELFYLSIAKSIEELGVIDCPSLRIKGRHSLTMHCVTWLFLDHGEFGRIAILQNNFSFEAVLFDELSLFTINLGIDQKRALETLFHVATTERRFGFISTYSESKPSFGGLNLHFPSPYHNINFGHYALLRVAHEGICLKTTGYVNPVKAFFCPKRLFPQLISAIALINEPGHTYWEEREQTPRFIVKAGHRHNVKDPGNKTLELLLQTASAFANEIDMSNQGYSLWLGLTSGHRSLINEKEVLEILVPLLIRRHRLKTIFIDGWTSGSVPSKETIVPTSYEQQMHEFSEVKAGIARLDNDIHVISLIGSTYERKVSIANSCSFFLTSAFTTSIVPSRICNLNGIVHVSNAGRPSIGREHIHRKAQLVPSHLVQDMPPEKEDQPGWSYSYKIDLVGLEAWISDMLNKPKEVAEQSRCVKGA
jgi:hypothetical protein